MRYSPLLIPTIIITFIISDCYSQLVADAGKDTAVCADSPNVLTIGGSPTATGGVPPYQYTWSGSYEYAGRNYLASSMLEDTTVANPVFLEGAMHDSVVLYVNVTDQNEDKSMDSIRIRQSSYIYCLGECRYDIKEGDSVQLGHCVAGGISPLQYNWTPSENLSNSIVQNPWAKPGNTTTYTLQIIDSIGCQAVSTCLISIIPAAIRYLSGKPRIEIYPHPSSGILYVKFDENHVQSGSFELINLLGKSVYMTFVEDPITSIDIQHLTPGIYIYQWISTDKELASGKIMVE